MGKLTIAQLQPGMKVEEDVRAPGGQLLLGAGSELNEKTIRILKTWGVNAIKVIGEGDGGVGVDRNISPEELEAAKSQILARFSKCNITVEPMQNIFDYAVRYCALHQGDDNE